MTVRILIQRRVSEGLGPDLDSLLSELRFLARRFPGYMGGESLRNSDDPEEKLVISTWESLEHWENWVQSPERQELQRQVDELLQEPTWYQIYVSESLNAD